MRSSDPPIFISRRIYSKPDLVIFLILLTFIFILLFMLFLFFVYATIVDEDGTMLIISVILFASLVFIYMSISEYAFQDQIKIYRDRMLITKARLLIPWKTRDIIVLKEEMKGYKRIRNKNAIVIYTTKIPYNVVFKMPCSRDKGRNEIDLLIKEIKK